MELYLYSFNNYYNRIVKKYDTLEEYGNPITVIQGTSFNPNDGVYTEHIINYEPNSDVPDYLIAAEQGVIVSRWFITESGRTRALQFKLSLYRDLIADHYNELLHAPIFIEKGYVNTSDPAIYNGENMTFNQIKKSERLLKDGTGIPWIVGYYSLPRSEEEETHKIDYGIPQLSYHYAETNLGDWDFFEYINNPKSYISNLKLGIKVVEQGTTNIPGAGITSNITANVDEEGAYNFTKTSGEIEYAGLYIIRNSVDVACNALKNTYESTLNGVNISEFAIVNNYEPASDSSDLSGYSYNDIEELSGLILRTGPVGNYRFYTIRLKKTQKEIKKISQGDLDVFFNEWIYLAGEESQGMTYGGVPVFSGQAQPGTYSYSFILNSIQIELEEILPYTGRSFNISKNRRSLRTAPYCMFAIPAAPIEYNGYKTNDAGITIAAGIAKSAGANVYDVQLLPFCPVTSLANKPLKITDQNTEGAIDLGDLGMTEGIDYIIIQGEDETVADQVLFWCSEDSRTFYINLNDQDDSDITTIETDPILFKRNMLTRFCRFCSPNYNGVFEFNPYKNGGSKTINVDFKYKPFSPYIHLNPDFSNLYGKDFNDARGLILGGDFSLPIINSAWENYQINNKNYQVMFDRQIENMGINQDVARVREIVGSVAGVAGGAVAGAKMGGVGGAIAGAGVAAVGGVMDYALNERLRNEAIDYTKDLYYAQLDNIKALPNSLTKIDSFNPNNKIFPFIEYYHATEVEEKAIEDKLKYNGMTINRIGTISEFINYNLTGKPIYIKGQLIRLEGISDDFHIVNAISSELFKGVFI